MGSCEWGFHDWAKWKRLEANKALISEGKEHAIVVPYQKRVCKRCGKIETERLEF